MGESIGGVNDSNWEREVSNCQMLVLANFYSESCELCKPLAKDLVELAEEYSERVKFVKVNVDADTDLAIRRGIQKHLPRLQFIIEDKAVGEMEGYHQKKEIKEMIEEYLDNINSYL